MALPSLSSVKHCSLNYGIKYLSTVLFIKPFFENKAYIISTKLICVLHYMYTLYNLFCFVKISFQLFIKIMYYQYITSNLREFVYTVSYMYFALYVDIITFVLFCQNLFIKLLLKITYYSYITPNLSVFVFVHTVPYMCSVLICLNHNIYFVLSNLFIKRFLKNVVCLYQYITSNLRVFVYRTSYVCYV